jgi:hypothetical protein
VVPNLPEQAAGNQEEGSPARKSPGDFERGEEVDHMETPPKTDHSKPLVEELSSTPIGLEKEPGGQDTEGPSVQEKKSEDSKFGGAPESVPRQDPSQERGQRQTMKSRNRGRLCFISYPPSPRQFTRCPSRRSDPP